MNEIKEQLDYFFSCFKITKEIKKIYFIEIMSFNNYWFQEKGDYSKIHLEN